MSQELTTIGRAERVSLPDVGAAKVPAKIDTGADVSAIWASRVEEADGRLRCIFFGPGSEFYTGKEVVFPKSSYTITRVANSFGHREIRYKVKLRILVKGRLIRASFTLSDRSQKTYPILLGRRLLRGKFIVDVTLGDPLEDVERVKKQKMQRELDAS